MEPVLNSHTFPRDGHCRILGKGRIALFDQWKHKISGARGTLHCSGRRCPPGSPSQFKTVWEVFATSHWKGVVDLMELWKEQLGVMPKQARSLFPQDNSLPWFLHRWILKYMCIIYYQMILQKIQNLYTVIGIKSCHFLTYILYIALNP